jgi:hypothetical protein
MPELAAKNRTFYDWATPTSGDAASIAEYEQRYPPLDLLGAEPGYLGVKVVRGGVRFSRPKNWAIREASNEPGNAFVQYISWRAYSFAIYERPDSPSEPWRDIVVRFEKDVAAMGAKVMGKGVPTATWRGQGRAYAIERKVKAGKLPFVSHSREILLRGEHRIVLVQIVHEGETFSGIDQELGRALGTIEVL